MTLIRLTPSTTLRKLFPIRSCIQIVVSLVLVYTCVHALFSNVGQYVTPDDLVLPDQIVHVAKKPMPKHDAGSVGEWMNYIFVPHSVIQSKLEIVKNNFKSNNSTKEFSLHFEECHILLNAASTAHLVNSTCTVINNVMLLNDLQRASLPPVFLFIHSKQISKLEAYLKVGMLCPQHIVINGASLLKSTRDNYYSIQDITNIMSFFGLQDLARTRYNDLTQTILLSSVLSNNVVIHGNPPTCTSDNDTEVCEKLKLSDTLIRQRLGLKNNITFSSN